MFLQNGITLPKFNKQNEGKAVYSIYDNGVTISLTPITSMSESWKRRSNWEYKESKSMVIRRLILYNKGVVILKKPASFRPRIPPECFPASSSLKG